MLDSARIGELLQPFFGDDCVSPELAGRLHTYLELLLRWNARINLTAVRGPEQIVTRHFGESLFVARVLRTAGAFSASDNVSLADVGSGAGFPGIPIKLLAPEIQVTLIESQNKKATFLREVVRGLNLDRTEVFCGRAESWNQKADIVTLRAVERFESVLPTVASLVCPGGALCVLIGARQVPSLRQALGDTWQIDAPQPIPLSDERVVVVARR